MNTKRQYRSNTARRIGEGGKFNDPANETGREYADVLRLAAEKFDPGSRNPVIVVFEGGKKD